MDGYIVLAIDSNVLQTRTMHAPGVTTLQPLSIRIFRLLQTMTGWTVLRSTITSSSWRLPRDSVEGTHLPHGWRRVLAHAFHL